MTSLIIDTDGGIDDALAILVLLNAGQSKIKLINATGGNVDNKQAYKNIKALLHLCGRKIKVSRGRNISFSGRKKRDGAIHGTDGLGNTFLADYVKIGKVPDAVSAFKKAIEKDGISKILAIGPLTNLADVFLKYPNLTEHIDEIWLAGGALGKKGSSGKEEFNFYFDPQAVEIVFRTQALIKLVTVDVTGKILFGRNFIKNFEDKKGDIHRFILKILEFSYCFSYNKRGLKAAHLPDLITACLFLDENLAHFRKVRVSVDEKTGYIFENSAGREILMAENLNQTKIKEKALQSLLELKGRKK